MIIIIDDDDDPQLITISPAMDTHSPQFELHPLSSTLGLPSRTWYHGDDHLDVENNDRDNDIPSKGSQRPLKTISVPPNKGSQWFNDQGRGNNE